MGNISCLQSSSFSIQRCPLSLVQSNNYWTVSSSGNRSFPVTKRHATEQEVWDVVSWPFSWYWSWDGNKINSVFLIYTWNGPTQSYQSHHCAPASSFSSFYSFSCGSNSSQGTFQEKLTTEGEKGEASLFLSSSICILLSRTWTHRHSVHSSLLKLKWVQAKASSTCCRLVQCPGPGTNLHFMIRWREDREES